VDAYPATYRRPAVAYTAASIASGMMLYAEHCARCHGRDGGGDGPDGRGLPRAAADLRAPHTGQHTAGDLFWWISHGIPGAGMPSFADRLDESARWDLVNLVRALSAAAQARRLGATVEPERPRVVAPDASFAVGPTPSRSLKEQRGRRLVLLVLYTLPGSRDRLAQLARDYPPLLGLGLEVIAVPRDADPDAIRRLGADPAVLFPVVTDGAADIVGAYGLFSRAPHAEFLIDRQGYLRAVGAGEWSSHDALRAAVQQLNAERVVAPIVAEHVH
jgi:putative copper resistance protein D